MKYSTLIETQQSRDMIDAFGGYNHNLRIAESEFFDMKNMTADNYPVMSPRHKRGKLKLTDYYHVPHYVTGMTSKEHLIYVDFNISPRIFFYNDGVFGDDEIPELTTSKKEIISMGSYLIVLPDKRWINLSMKGIHEEGTDYGSIENFFESDGEVHYQMCRVDGTEYENATESETAPSSPSNGDYWIDTSATPHTLKQYIANQSMWTPIVTTYVRISAKDIAKGFKQYDGVKISGMAPGQLSDFNNKKSILYEVHRDDDGEGAGDYIVIVGFLDESVSQTTKLKVERKMPKMDFVIESGNRLWGCRYGTNEDNELVNEIYASKLGDFTNWDCYMGLSTDSYTVSCGSDGYFTGAISYMGNPIFFKENCIHKVFGNIPSNFQVQTTECSGVMHGAGRSLAIVHDVLFYKSRHGVCAFDGSMPKEVASALGDIHYTALDPYEGNDENKFINGAIATAHGNKYIINMKSEIDEKWYLLVYDTAKGIWTKEDEVKADFMCSYKNDVYFVDSNDKQIYTMFESGDLVEEEEKVEWMVESGVLTTDMPDRKYISKVNMRMSLGVGSSVMIYIQYDSCGDWEHVSTMTGTSLRSFTLPIRPKRCDHFRLKLLGWGDANIYSISKTIEQGSDR